MCCLHASYQNIYDSNKSYYLVVLISTAISRQIEMCEYENERSHEGLYVLNYCKDGVINRDRWSRFRGRWALNFEHVKFEEPMIYPRGGFT